ncbi:hypothetical protein GQ55_3G036900 [Panicum hallii var. hallii]|uniref:AIPP2-like SPOC-like domain-containing protein n=1 Tax=Panicum hallii var. hallii TaxID=1504633 RepID=A0A2T7E5E0_9POAL|nr:hypothetical protein GQ55_3G036900 [Panicum hallii var. hallii]
MNGQTQPSRSNFGPRLKLADRLPLRKGRFRSKPMLKIQRECQNHQANMKYMNIVKRSRIVNDQRANVAKQLAEKNPPKDNNVRPRSALLAKNSESKHSGQPTTLSLENSLNLSPMDFKCSKTSRVRNIDLSEKMKMAAPSKSKDDSNATSRCLEQPHHVESSYPTQLNVMASLVHKANNVDLSNLNNGALGSRSKGWSNPYQGEYINVRKDGTKKSNPIKKRRVSRKSNIAMVSGLLVADNNDPNKEKGRQDEVMTKEKGMIGYRSEIIAMSRNGHKQTSTTKTNEVPNSSSLLVGKKHVQGLRNNLGDNSSHLFGKTHSRLQGNNASFMEGRDCARVSSKHVLSNEFIETNLKLPNRDKLVGGNGKTNNGKCRRRKQPLLEEMLDTHGGIGSDGAVQHDLTCRSMKRWKCIEDTEDEEDNDGDQHATVVENDEGAHLENLTFVPVMNQGRCTETNEGEVDGGYQNPFGVENDCEGVQRLGTYKSKKKRRKYIETNKYQDEMCDQHQVRGEDGTNELTQAALSKHCVEQQCYCCSKPIDKHGWSGIFKIDDKEYISLTGHFSTKSCEKVRKLSLPRLVQVTKVPRLAAWPKIWKASKPTGDSIGLYFFPHEMRHDEELDQLLSLGMMKN